jgi:NTP pyrophosphatase (non-canonical NTP hydrolase)
MDFKKYQQEAQKTAQIPRDKEVQYLIERIIPLLGLAGETGELLSEYKKHLRDGPAHKLFSERVAEELGDLLWYISDLATKFELNLDEIAKNNLKKVRERFLDNLTETRAYYFDRDFPENERLPRKFEFIIKEVQNGEMPKVQCFYNGKQIGDDLTDNSHYPDGYRFHDVFHFAHAAVLDWSPVTRSIMKRKRKSDSKTDEVEDGGRAIAIEEGVTALIFSYAEAHDFLVNISRLDYGLLKTIAYLTERLQVKQCLTGDWEKAILVGYQVWHEVCKNKGGKIIGDIDKQTLVFEKL